MSQLSRLDTKYLMHSINFIYQGRAKRGPWAFDELRRYHTRPSRFSWCPENVHLGEKHFRDLNIDAKIIA